VGATVRYLALGDSFTIGTGIPLERSFPRVLGAWWRKRGLEVALLQPAVNGYATDDLIAHELPVAREFRPDLVTLLIGANDLVRGSSQERYRAQIRRIHDHLRAAGIAASAVVALPQPDWSLSPAARAYGEPADLRARIEAFNSIAREDAERAGSRYVDLFPLMREQAERGMLADDRLHPSAEAHAEWADALDPLLSSSDGDYRPRR
jgi:acyl-CoA thioesterase-1